MRQGQRYYHTRSVTKIIGKKKQTCIPRKELPEGKQAFIPRKQLPEGKQARSLSSFRNKYYQNTFRRRHPDKEKLSQAEKYNKRKPRKFLLVYKANIYSTHYFLSQQKGKYHFCLGKGKNNNIYQFNPNIEEIPLEPIMFHHRHLDSLYWNLNTSSSLLQKDFDVKQIIETLECQSLYLLLEEPILLKDFTDSTFSPPLALARKHGEWTTKHLN